MTRNLIHLILIFKVFGLTSCVTKKIDKLPPLLHNEKLHDLRSTVANEKIRKPFIWKVVRDGKVSHLFGTMHIGISINQFPVWLKNIFLASKTFIMESDPNQQIKTKYSRQLIDKIILNGTTLDKLINYESFYYLSVDSLIPASSLRLLTPTAAKFAYQLSIKYRAGLQFAGVLDINILKEAQKNKMGVVYLESSGDVQDALSSISLKNYDKHYITAQQLQSFIENESYEYKLNQQEEFYRLVMNYKKGDALYDKGRDDDFDNILLKDRNNAWLPKLEQQLEQGDCFVAVGALHLVGKHNLVELLREKGFEIKRL